MSAIRISILRLGLLLTSTILWGHIAIAQTGAAAGPTKIILVAGETAKVDKEGHHDYLAGCKCLDALLRQTPGVQTVQVTGGWPDDTSIFKGASTVVFYTDGGGKQAFLNSPERIATLQSLVDSGVGLVMIHQAVDFPDEFADLGTSWIGGIYRSGSSGRGHWDSHHVDFPSHEIAHGVSPWTINDGWLNGLQFVADMQGVTPLIWSGKKYAGSRAGLDGDIVSWAYDRPDGGRSFCYTGLDAHSAWSLPGMRQLMINGVLWSAGTPIDANGAPCKIIDAQLKSMLTPRQPKQPTPKTNDSAGKK